MKMTTLQTPGVIFKISLVLTFFILPFFNAAYLKHRGSVQSSVHKSGAVLNFSRLHLTHVRVIQKCTTLVGF